MSNSSLSGAVAGNLKVRAYKNICGVDFSGQEVSTSRSPEMLNMWKNYSNLAKSIESRPGLKKLVTFENNVFGMFFYKISNVEHIIVHSGTSLYDYNTSSEVITTIKETGMNPAKSEFFVYNNILYIKDGINYLEYNGETCSEVVGFIPTTTIGRNPTGGGTTYQDVNMLTGKRKNSFCADGTSTTYHLDVEELTSSTVRIWINDTEISTGYTVNSSNATITFNTAPDKPLTDGQDNVIIEFEKTVEGYRDRIDKCTLLSVFDNRVFFSGNQDYPNALWHTSLDNPRYCSDTDYYTEGLDLAPIKALIPGNNNLWVMKEPSQSNTTVFYHTPITDEIGKCYPSNHSSISTGCVGTGINFNDDIVFFSDRGMEGISGDINTEQVLAHRSSLVDAKLLKETNYKDMILEEYKGYLLVIIGNKIYLADSQNMFQNQMHNEYEWFYWEMSKAIKSTFVKNNVLYIGTDDGIYTLTKIDTNINSYFCTTKDNCGYPQLKKDTNKKGFNIDITAGEELTVEVRTDNNDFEIVDTFSNTKGYIVPQIKKKKWKDIQFKFSSETPFSINKVIFEYYVGSYIKR